VSVSLREDLSWLYSRESMGIKLGLSNVRILLRRLGDPQDSFRSVHVAGTNGKGSVCAMIASVLRSAGYRTGLYTSPHLVRFSERMVVQGQEVPEPELARLLSEMRDMVDGGRFARPPTFFEVVTAMAFLHFARQRVEVAVVEVGMGGRLDATNVVHPLCCVITRIGKEHTSFLGDTLGKIAYEKASIIKEGVPTISSPQFPGTQRVISWMARCRSAPLRVLGKDFRFECLERNDDGTTVRLHSLGTELRLGLLGGYQCENAALAAECALELGRGMELPRESIVRGLSTARWPGRLEVVSRSPLLVMDVTHTPEGACTLARELDVFRERPRVLVIGMLRDKDAEGILTALAPHFDHLVCTSPDTPRALPIPSLMHICRTVHPHCSEIPGVREALKEGRRLAGKEGMLMVSGSLYTVGEAMKELEGGDGP
jgi:dihydrofolate synthase/folylpolyglutamate synthase